MNFSVEEKNVVNFRPSVQPAPRLHGTMMGGEGLSEFADLLLK
jgi:hypothetical protein